MPNQTQKPLMELKDISLTLGSEKKLILQNISLDIYYHDFIILLGGNGSGKSSLLKCLDLSLPVTQGEIYFKGTSIPKLPKNKYSREVVTLGQDLESSLFYDLTVYENILIREMQFQRYIFQKARPQDFYREYLDQFNQNLFQKLGTQVRKLSGGERQSLALGLSLLHPPAVLLLDEHTSALDPHRADVIMKLTNHHIQKSDITTIMTTHELDQALKYGNRLIALKEGQLIFDVQGEDKKRLSLEDLENLYKEGDYKN
jgi:putative ABC transport system ATP-binding protein